MNITDILCIRTLKSIIMIPYKFLFLNKNTRPIRYIAIAKLERIVFKLFKNGIIINMKGILDQPLFEKYFKKYKYEPTIIE